MVYTSFLVPTSHAFPGFAFIRLVIKGNVSNASKAYEHGFRGSRSADCSKLQGTRTTPFPEYQAAVEKFSHRKWAIRWNECMRLGRAFDLKNVR